MLSYAWFLVSKFQKGEEIMVKTLEESKRILQHNFETFREAYRKKHDADFLGSDDLTMFFRNTDDLEKIIRFNQDAKKT
jgi:hypothetical protein